MFGFKYRLLSFIVVLAVGIVWLDEVQAMDLSKPLPKLSAREVLHYGPSSAFFEQYDQGVQGECGPLLAHLNKTLQSTDGDVLYSARLVYAELYDRAVCVEHSPQKSFEYFKQAAESGGSNFYAHVGWKYYHGHGIEKSEAKANEAFKLLLTRAAFVEWSRSYESYEKLLRDRPMPVLLKVGIDWLRQETSTDEGLIKLAQALLEGTGTYLDGTPLMKDSWSAKNIFTSLSVKRNSKAMFIFAKAILNGQIPFADARDATFHLRQAADCGYVPAMIELAYLAKTGEHNTRKNKREAYGWLLMAQRSGASVAEELEIAKRNAGSYYQMSVPNDKRFMLEHRTCK